MRSALLSLSFLLFFNLLYPQNSWDKEISFTLLNENLPQAFSKITQVSGFRFAYNPQIIDTSHRYTQHFDRMLIDSILLLLLPDTIRYKISGNHIILNLHHPDPEVISEPIIISDSSHVELPENNETETTPKKNPLDSYMEKTASSPSRIFTKRGDWIFEFTSGLRAEKYQIVDGNIKVVSGRRLSVPPLELNAAFTVQTNTSIETGIALICTRLNWNPENADYTFIRSEKLLPAYSSLQIPLRLKYYIPVWKTKLSLFAKMGFAFQFTLSKLAVEKLDNSPVSDSFENTIYTENDIITYNCIVRKSIPISRFNLLYNTGVGICYAFKNGIIISIMGEYYLGLIRMGGAILEYEKTQSPYPTYDRGNCKLLYHGDYWNVAFGISYRLKK